MKHLLSDENLLLAVLILLIVQSEFSTAFITQPSQSAKTLVRNLKHQQAAQQVLVPQMTTSNSNNQHTEIEKAKSLISNAISIGAPAYNSGDIAGCARVYKSTALEITSSLASSSLLPENIGRGLEEAINTSYANAEEEAWAFRRQFDSILGYVIPFTPQNPSDETNEKLSRLESFTDDVLPAQPLIVNDNVMGGMSQCQYITESRLFYGFTSLQNNGGFASLRWRFRTNQNWSYAKGLYLKIKHTNPQTHTFSLIVKDTTCEQARGANFKTVISNPNESEDPIFIPFDSFDQMEQMGRKLNGPIFNRGAVTEIGLMAIKPSVVGDFELKIDDWGLYI
mmetsp:Transcript_61551/g.74025  ORF Transcript_61551/g.74025 Transcript_61551/m.74025 type:complete len:338 (+) Transcript_61551:88-1101(+)